MAEGACLESMFTVLNRNEGSNPFLSARNRKLRGIMTKYSFKNDYSEGAHPRILEALSRSNFEQHAGYGYDIYSEQAANLIKSLIKNNDASVFFVSGGTQANLISIAAILKPYESIIATDIGHIATHETGAIEALGHKINTVVNVNGKISVGAIKEVIASHSSEHMVAPKAVFISNSTEVGTIYNKQELSAISECCRQNDLFLYLDGARMGSALMANSNDLSLAEIAQYVDMFYIGGTKNGALFGEAIVINNPVLQEKFRFYIKQKGALLAKGRVLGTQFVELFRDGLFFELAERANNMAAKLAVGLCNNNSVEFYEEPVSNQIFPILSNALINKLSEYYEFSVWQQVGEDKSVIRLVTSWATREDMVDEFIKDFSDLVS